MAKIVLLEDVSDVFVEAFDFSDDIKIDITDVATVDESPPMEVDITRKIQVLAFSESGNDIVNEAREVFDFFRQLLEIRILVVLYLVFKCRDQSERNPDFF